MESDWKKFRALIPVVRERYLAERNARIIPLHRAESETQAIAGWASTTLSLFENRLRP